VVLLAALVNAPAVAAAAAGEEGDVTILCAGTRDRFSLEDFLTAGLLVHELRQRGGYTLRDGARAALDLYGLYRGDVAGGIRGSLHGRHLIELGFDADLDYSSRIGLLSTVPVYQGGLIKNYG